MPMKDTLRIHWLGSYSSSRDSHSLLSSGLGSGEEISIRLIFSPGACAEKHDGGEVAVAADVVPNTGQVSHPLSRVTSLLAFRQFGMRREKGTISLRHSSRQRKIRDQPSQIANFSIENHHRPAKIPELFT